MFAVLGARAQVAKARADDAQMSVNIATFCAVSAEYMKYQLEHDTIHGRFKGTVEITDTGLKVNGLDISLSATRDPTEIPWGDVGVDYVCESTGAFCTTEGGMKKVVISAPAKDADTPTIVVGVNTEEYDPAT